MLCFSLSSFAPLACNSWNRRELLKRCSSHPAFWYFWSVHSFPPKWVDSNFRNRNILIRWKLRYWKFNISLAQQLILAASSIFFSQEIHEIAWNDYPLLITFYFKKINSFPLFSWNKFIIIFSSLLQFIQTVIYFIDVPFCINRLNVGLLDPFLRYRLQREWLSPK